MIGQQIDVRRLHEQNNRLQFDNINLHEKYKKSLQEVSNIVQINRHLKFEIEQLHQNRNKEIQHHIANQKLFYQTEIQKILADNNHNVLHLRQEIQQEKDAHYNQQIQDIRTHVHTLESQQKYYQNQYEKIQTEILQNPQKQQELVKLRKQKQEYRQRLLEEQLSLKQLQRHEQSSKLKLNEMQHIITHLEESVKQVKAEFINKLTEHENLAQKEPKQWIKELKELREENAELQNSLEMLKLSNTSSNDDDLIALLKQFHQEIAILRHSLNLAQNYKHSQNQHLFHERAQHQIYVLKTEKEIQFYKKQHQDYRQQVQKSSEDKRKIQRIQNLIRKMAEQKNILEGKIFVLEAMTIAEKHRKPHPKNKYSTYLKEFQRKISMLINEENKNTSHHHQKSKVEAYYKEIISLRSIVEEMNEKMQELDSQKQNYQKKYKIYKEKHQEHVESFEQKQNSYLKSIQHYKIKIEGYDKLTHKFQEQLEKSILSSNMDVKYQKSEQFILNYENKMLNLKLEVTRLQNQMKTQQEIYRNELYFERESYNKIIIENQELKTYNTELMKKLRNSQNSFLEQQLAQISLKSNKNYQMDALEKSQINVKLTQELRELNIKHEIQIQELNERHKAMLESLQRQITQLLIENEQLLSLKHQKINLHQSEITNLQQQILSMQKMFEQESKTENNNVYIGTLFHQINKLKEQEFLLRNEIVKERENGVLHVRREKQNHDKVQILSEEIEKMKHQLHQKEDKMFNLNIELNRQQNDLNIYEINLKMSKEKITNLQEQISHYQEDANTDFLFKEKTLTYTNEINQLKIVITDLEHKISLNKTSNQHLYDENTNLLYKVSEAEIKINNLIKNIDKYQRDNIYLKEQNEKKMLEIKRELNIKQREVEELVRRQEERYDSQKISLSSSQELQGYTENVFEELRAEIERKNKEIDYYISELNQIESQRNYEKEMFQVEWNNMMQEINHLKQTMRDLQETKQHYHFDESEEIVRLNKEIISLQMRMLEKDNIIENKEHEKNQLQQELFKLKIQAKSTDDKEAIRQLRGEIHRQMELKYTLQSTVRRLEQELSLATVKRISEEPMTNEKTQHLKQQVVSENTYLKQQIQALTHRNNELSVGLDQHCMSKNDYISRNEQYLMILFVAFTEIQSLRVRMQEEASSYKALEEKYQGIVNKLSIIRHKQYQSSEDGVVNTDLIKELQCRHEAIMKIQQAQVDQLEQLKFRQVDSVVHEGQHQNESQKVDTSNNTYYQSTYVMQQEAGYASQTQYMLNNTHNNSNNYLNYENIGVTPSQIMKTTIYPSIAASYSNNKQSSEYSAKQPSSSVQSSGIKYTQFSNSHNYPRVSGNNYDTSSNAIGSEDKLIFSSNSSIKLQSDQNIDFSKLVDSEKKL